MNISDEKLGAFLDRELPDHEMNAINIAVANDNTLAARLAALASADALLKRHASALDSRPMPDGVLTLLQAEADESALSATAAQTHKDSATTDNVVPMSRWQEKRQSAGQWFNRHVALAAGIALVVGFTGGQFLDDADRDATGSMMAMTLDSDVSNALDTQVSGEALIIDDATRIQSRFSFVDTNARRCRQFVLQQNGHSSENIACHTQQGWELIASVVATGANAGEYQTASGNSMLDSALDAMMTGNALSLDKENELISRQWQ
ncbi:hypothetical protein PHACT_07270 [Pseudohongiella acticola]|uniref:Anti sigma-E protein RseA N-terminal domain-containing protein n=1 Tax=Pseudohongiella acticola TaxID=1524254 RepID=A0A1E8CKP1_9GAMM|nr:hypothetical protein [Pseudohongiella acticola]OFE12963.1 hypothetical protein PHACT_07270 [Pseudohongiella acticola]